MKISNVILTLVLILGLASVATAVTVVDYGWEDGGDVLGIYPDPALPSIIATNVAGWDGEPVHSGNFSLKLEDNAPSSTPQAFIVFFWNLLPGDVIDVGFWRYDTTPGAAPSVRIWGHWNDELPGNPDGYSGSASGELDYGPGTGWDYTSFSYTVTGNTGLVIEARTYSVDGDIVWIDDLHIEMPDHVWAQIPGCSPVGTESESWGGVKALFR
ncbi:MAG: hypothetical protein ABFS42_07180 [Candidatus Krumholzibacteriota bacterium]